MINHLGGRPSGKSSNIVQSLIFEVQEFTATNTSVSEVNKFDVIAEVTFTHSVSASTVTTEMFWTAGDTWKFRFMPDETGTWNYTSKADGTGNTTNDPQLDGLTGSISVSVNANAYGLITSNGNRWARQKGDKTTLVDWSPFWRMKFNAIGDYGDTNITTVLNDAFTDEGADAIYFDTVGGAWADFNLFALNPHTWPVNTDPDPVSFDAIEHALAHCKANNAGLYFWLFGDGTRNEDAVTGFGVSWETSTEFQRLMRYIAARLGAYPNWAAGFGFDIWEDHTEADVSTALTYLQGRLQHNHMLGARDQNGTTTYDRTGVTSRTHDEHGQDAGWALPSYATFESYLSGKSTPQANTDRWWTDRVSEADQVRGIHRGHIAGGMTAILGSAENNVNGVGGFKAGDYVDPVPFKTARTAWTEARFNGTVDADTLISGTGSVGGLRASDSSSFVFYIEGSSSNQTLDLSGSAIGTLTVKLIDLTIAYSENTSQANVTNASGQTITLPSSSDWLIVIGE